MNKAIIYGQLGADPDVRYTTTGTAVTTINVATNEFIAGKDGGESKTHTEWHRVVIFGKRAETVGQYLKKGSSVLVEGVLRTREWEDSSGNKRKTTEIQAYSIEFGPKSNGNSGGGTSQPQNRGKSGASSQKQQKQSFPDDLDDMGASDDDIPF